MATKQNQFLAEIGNAPTPVAADGGLLIAGAQRQAAGLETAAKASVVGKEANLVLAKDAASQGMEAVKGKLKSDMEDGIRKTIDDYDRSVQVAEAGLKLTLFDQGNPNITPKEVENAKAVLMKFKDALSQGTMTREQALLAIDRQVKEYSRTMPGWSKDFRQLAQEITGIDKLGSYREYTLLSQAGIRDTMLKQAAEQQQKLNERMLNLFVDKYARPPVGGLEGSEMSLFREHMALEQGAKAIKTEIDARDGTVQQNEPRVQNYVNMKMAMGMMDLSQKLQGIVNQVDPKTGKPIAPENKVILRQQVLSDINRFFESLKGELLTFNTNQVSNATRETMLNRINTQQKDMVTALQNQDAFDDFKKTMEITQARAEGIMSNWAIAHPQLEIIRRSGIATPENATFWFGAQQDPRRAADFVRIYGKGLDDYYRTILGGGAGAANRHIDVMSRAANEPGFLTTLEGIDKPAHQAVTLALKDHINNIAANGWGESPETQNNRKNNFGTIIQSFTEQIKVTEPNSLENWTKMMADPRVATRIKELPPEQQNRAMTAIVMKSQDILQNPDFGVMKRLTNLNTNNPGYFALAVNPLTGLLEATHPDIEQETVTKPKHEQKSVVRLSSIAKEVKDLLKFANRSISTLENLEAVPTDRKFADDIRQKFNAGYFAMPLEEREKALNAGAKAAGATGEKKTTPKADSDGPSPTSAGERKMVGEMLSEEERLMSDVNELLNLQKNLAQIDKELSRADLGQAQREVLLNQKAQLQSIKPEDVIKKIQRLLSLKGTGDGGNE